MNDQPIVGILGATGWLGGALARNLLRGGWPAARLALANRRGPTADFASWPGVVWADGLSGLAASAGVIVLSVRPEDYTMAVPRDFSGLVLSFMAGVGLDRLSADWPAARIVRAMPGGGATGGTAHVPWCAGAAPTAADAAQVERLLSALGTVDRVADEGQLAVMAALSGSGAAYPALMARTMYDHALSRGIAPDVAARAVLSVVCDAPALFRHDMAEAARLLDAYRSYRGITAAGLDAAEAAGFASALGRALDAATDKALRF